jgi:hypothetical protein
MRSAAVIPEPVAVLAVETCENSKLGAVSATWVSQASCPHDCKLFHEGCYAEVGRAGFVTRRLNSSRVRGALRLAQLEARAIDRLTGDRLLRLHVVGDARTDAAAAELAAAAKRYERRGMLARRGRKVWTYTHAWRKVARASWGAVSVLASCETPADAAAALAKGYAAALVVPAFEQEAAYDLAGVKVLPCPNQTRGVRCRDCGLCLDADRLHARGLVIGFAAHSQGAGAVRQTLLSLATV